jgi:copper resistance protein D
LTLLAPAISKRAPFFRYLWAAFFLIPGLYLFVYSDPESWPTGNQTLYHVLTVNHQVLQHKIFSLLLLGLGAVEVARVRKNLMSLWAAAAFPVMAAAGALLLLFHAHPMPPGTQMSPVEHLSMLKVEHQHLQFSVVGFGIALSKAAVDISKRENRIARSIFSVLMVALGVLLIRYTE